MNRETKTGESLRTYAEEMDANYKIESTPTYEHEIGGEEALKNMTTQTQALGQVLDRALQFAMSIGPTPLPSWVSNDSDLDEGALDDVLQSIGPSAKIEIVSKLLHDRISDPEFFERMDWALGYAARSLKAASEALAGLLTSAPGWPELLFDRANHIGSAAFELDEALSCEPATEVGYAKFRD